MAKFVSVPLKVVKKLKDLAAKNGADSILDNLNQHSFLFDFGILKNRKLLDQAEAKGHRLFLRNEWRRIVQAATMKKPLGVKKSPIKIGKKYDFSGMNPFPEDQISAVRGRAGVVKETMGKSGKIRRVFKAAENKLPKAPSKRERRIKQEMDLAAKRSQLRERARTNNPMDVIDYLLSK